MSVVRSALVMTSSVLMVLFAVNCSPLALISFPGDAALTFLVLFLISYVSFSLIFHFTFSRFPFSCSIFPFSFSFLVLSLPTYSRHPTSSIFFLHLCAFFSPLILASLSHSLLLSTLMLLLPPSVCIKETVASQHLTFNLTS